MNNPQKLSMSAVEYSLADIWTQALKLETVKAEDNFFNLGGHSLLALSVIEQIKLRLGWIISLSTFIQYPTIRELVTNASQPTAANSERLLIKMSKRGRLKPIVFVPAIGGMIFSYTKLARHLSANRSCYALQSPALIGQPVPETVSLLAALYIETLVSELGTNDFHLVGWSYGGLVAFEMMRQLRTGANRKLVLIDSFLRPEKRTLPDEDVIFKAFVDDLLSQFGMQADMPEGISRPQALQALAARLFGAHANNCDAQSFEFIERMYHAYLANLQAMMAYQCGAADVSAALLFPTESNDTVAHWRDRVDNLEVIDLQGDHYSLLNDKNAAQIATATAAYLDQPAFVEQRADAGVQL